MIFELYDHNYPLPESLKKIGPFFSFSRKSWKLKFIANSSFLSIELLLELYMKLK